jgi:hypothetical protein
MVTHINVALDDDLADRAREVKEDRDWSWAELIANAVDEFEAHGDE